MMNTGPFWHGSVSEDINIIDILLQTTVFCLRQKIFLRSTRPSVRSGRNHERLLKHLRLSVAEIGNLRCAVPPVLLHLDPKVQINLDAEKFFQILAGISPYSLERFTIPSDQDALMRFLFAENFSPDFNQREALQNPQ